MKKTIVAAVTLAGLGLATAAHAQDASWTGPYVGAFAGYLDRSDRDEAVAFDTNLDGTFNNTVNTAAGANAFSPGFCAGFPNGNSAAGGCSKDDNSEEVGVRLGYDWQVGSFVVGAVAEASRTNMRDNVTAFSTTPAAYTFTRKLKSMAAARARVGYAMGDSLFYGTGGYARGDFKRTYFTTNTANQFPLQYKGKDPDGYQFGLGYERRLAPGMTLGLEWIRTKLKDDRADVVRAAGPAPATNPFILVNAQGTDLRRTGESFKTDSFRVTTSFRF